MYAHSCCREADSKEYTVEDELVLPSQLCRLYTIALCLEASAHMYDCCMRIMCGQSQQSGKL